MVSRMLVAVLLRWFVLAAAFGVTAWLLDGMEVNGGFGAYLWVSALFGLVNAVVGTVLRLLTAPLILVTVGLFSFIVTAVLLELTDWLTSHLEIDDFFWTAIWAALIISIVGVILEIIVRATLLRAVD
jgi:putative membrane protein